MKAWFNKLYGFVVRCLFIIILSVYICCDAFTHIFQGYVSGTGITTSNTREVNIGNIERCYRSQNTTKHTKKINITLELQIWLWESYQNDNEYIIILLKPCSHANAQYRKIPNLFLIYTHRHPIILSLKNISLKTLFCYNGEYDFGTLYFGWYHCNNKPWYEPPNLPMSNSGLSGKYLRTTVAPLITWFNFNPSMDK